MYLSILRLRAALQQKMRHFSSGNGSRGACMRLKKIVSLSVRKMIHHVSFFPSRNSARACTMRQNQDLKL
jgi:hypothetical protein